jgi:hypothetical protein
MGITSEVNGDRHVAVSRRLTWLVLFALTVAVSSAAAADAVGFEQDQRVNALTLQFGTDEFATANAFGGAFVGSAARSQMQASLDSSVADGSTSWLLEMPGLTDLTGTDAPSINVGIMDGTPRLPAGNPSAYDGTSDLDWWYDPLASDIDPDGSAIDQLPASFTGGTFDAGPGAISLNMPLAGVPATVRMSSTRIRAVSGPSSTPLKSTNGFPPGHLPDENLPDSLTSFESMSAGQLAGDISAGSLAQTPIPPSLVGSGPTNCSRGYTSVNSMLDALVGGCTILGIQQIKPTQPDRAAVAGDVYIFTTDSGTKQVTGCTRNGASALLADCLAAAAYSIYLRFTSDRVIVLPVTPSPPPEPEPPPPPASPPPEDGGADTSPPDTTITKGPKDKTQKKTATFEFTGTDAKAVSSFQCKLDKQAFAPCTSPHTVKVKKGKHTFSVQAVDQAGNVGSPATDTWKVKRKRKK